MVITVRELIELGLPVQGTPGEPPEDQTPSPQQEERLTADRTGTAIPRKPTPSNPARPYALHIASMTMKFCLSVIDRA